jgi:signal transduction histidine kinase
MADSADTSRNGVAPRLLIVDDEEAQMRALCNTLSAEGYSTRGFTSPEAALEALRAEPFELLLTDLMMPGIDGIALMAAAKSVDPDLVGIVMTGHGTIDTAVKAMQAGALDYIQKPFRLKVILPVLQRGLEIRRLRAENSELRQAQATITRLNEELEQRVRDRTRELTQANDELAVANKDLESFSYSVSHDLRAPLRAVRGFAQIFLEEHGESIPAEGRPLLDRVIQGGDRMGQLIEDLLTFARFSRQPLVKRPLSLKPIVERLVAEQQSKQARPADVTIGELPECAGDAALLEQVLVNLLSNAFKFTRERDPAVIEVASRRDGSELIYFVRDNGAGFDMKYASKLFGVFQRMHSTEEFEGTGVGLSIVQRVIQRHGGRIWAEAAPGKGATFHFTLAPA